MKSFTKQDEEPPKEKYVNGDYVSAIREFLFKNSHPTTHENQKLGMDRILEINRDIPYYAEIS